MENNSDCCYWDGIKCDAKSGEVIELDLSCSCLHGRQPCFNNDKSSVSHPPSQWIDYLYLSGCGITEFPELLRTLEHLKRLDISNNKSQVKCLAGCGRYQN
ncbi:unnamed protein product [Microthlaspi erraticum]|uniref:Leucine-rich repeat-containing N-terminal plant-type domain-containing protein n=1 Tax=Microthlaspi erraticum TaxID=1685480 RepID=A0A6D2JIB1_9BRAS|nr:unnamed protein product [Microthlaspi erraticum]